MGMKSTVRFEPQQINYASLVALTLNTMPEGFIERRLLGNATAQDRDWQVDKLTDPFNDTFDFAQQLKAIDDELKRIRSEVTTYFWKNAVIKIETI